MNDATIEYDFARLAVHANGLDATARELGDIANRLVQVSSGLSIAGASAQAQVADAASMVKNVVKVLDYERARVAGYGTGLVVAERPFIALPPWHRDALLAGASARYLTDRMGNVVSTTKLSGTVDLSVGVAIASVDGQVSVSYTEVVFENGSRLITITDGAGIGGSVGTPDVGVPGTPSAQLAAMLTGRVGRSYVVDAGEGITSVLLREALLHQKTLRPELGLALDRVIGRLPRPDLDTTEVEVSAEGKAELVYSERAVNASFPWVRTEDHRNKTVTTEHGWTTGTSVLAGTGARAGAEGSVGVNVAVTRDEHDQVTSIRVTEFTSGTAKVVVGGDGPAMAELTQGVGATKSTERVIDLSDRPDLAAELEPLVEGHNWDMSAVAAVLRRHAGAQTTTERGTSTSVTVGADLQAAEVKVTVAGERYAVVNERLQPPTGRG